MTFVKLLLGAISIICLPYCPAFGQAESQTAPTAELSKTLKVVQNVELESLKGAVGMTISPDGRFLYAPGYMSATMHVFSIEPESGRIELVQQEQFPKVLAGATDFCLSPDGKLGMSSAFRSKAATFFQRDAQSGRLSMLQSIAQTDSGKAFQWPIRGTFSTDGKFAYFVDSGISQSMFIKKAPAVVVIKIADEKMEFVESFEPGHVLGNARGITVHPNGKHIFVTSSDGQALHLLARNEASGKLELVQTITEPNDVLEGAMSVFLDKTGKFVYTLSGRFRGKGGLAVFAFDESSVSLSFLESHLGGSTGLEAFKGGNQLAISPDGLRVYAIGSISGTISTFDRDPASGKLTPQETTSLRSKWKDSVAGVIVSPDNKYVYVSGGEKDPSITILETKP